MSQGSHALKSGLLRSRRNNRLAGLPAERLENRLCLSVTVSTLVQDGGNELKIVGGGSADVVHISDQGNGHIDVTDSKGHLLGAADDVSVIRFNGKGGQDSVSYTLANPLAHTESVFFNLGDAKDQVALDLSAGVDGGDLLLNVNAGAGADTITAALGSVTSGRLRLNVHGDDGADTISVTGSAVDVSADSVLRVNLFGDDGKDAITTALAGQVLGKLVLDVEGGAGIDTIAADVTANAGSTGIVRATERGGGGVDSVTLNLFDNSGDPESTLTTLKGKIIDRTGLDSLTETDNVTVVTGKKV